MPSKTTYAVMAAVVMGTSLVYLGSKRGFAEASIADLISQLPSGNVSLVEAYSASSVPQTVNGVATLNGLPVPANTPLYVFVNGVQVGGPVLTQADGSYTTTLIFQPSMFPAVFAVEVSDNTSDL